MEPVDDSQPLGGLGGTIEGREGDAFDGVEHPDSEGAEKLARALPRVIESRRFPVDPGPLHSGGLPRRIPDRTRRKNPP